jgi:hypothetical protein
MDKHSDIIAAVRRHHGGFDAATDAQCLTLWAALDAATQQRYLSAVSGRKSEAGSQTSEEKPDTGQRKSSCR